MPDRRPEALEEFFKTMGAATAAKVQSAARELEQERLGTALMRAARSNSLDVVEGLLADDAPADFRLSVNGTGLSTTEVHTPLLWAVRHGNAAMAKKLIMYGAGLETPVGDLTPPEKGEGGTPETVFSNTFFLPTPAMTELFLQHGANPNVAISSTTSSMRTTGWARSTALLDLLKSPGRLAHALVLLSYGADPNAPFSCEYTNQRGYHSRCAMSPLFVALRYIPDPAALLQAVAALLARGAQPNAVSEYTEHVPNPDCHSLPEDNPSTGHYISPVLCVQRHETPLHAAVRTGSRDLVLLLLKSGADPGIPSTRLDHPPIATIDLCPSDDLKALLISF